MTTRRALIAVLIAGLLLTACGEEALPVGSPLGDGTWRLVGAEVDGEPLRLIDSHPVTLTAAVDTLGGTAACNHYGGTLDLDGDLVSIDEIFMTEMACLGDGIMELESAYLAALARVDRAARDGDLLLLTGDGVMLRFEAVEPEPDAALIGPTWALETVLDGDAASTPTIHASIAFADDGTVTGHNGCNGFGGEYDPTDGFSDLYQTLIGCMGAIADQESHFMGVLGSEPTLVIEGKTLTILAPDGRGLVFRVTEPTPDALLIGPMWTLVTLVDGETASAPAADAWVRFLDDGTVTGNNGCNAFGGEYDAETGFSDLIQTEMACIDAIAAQEAHVMGVLGAAPALTIEGSMLTITAPDGRALVFRSH